MANVALADRIREGTRMPGAAPDPEDDYEAYRRADLRDRLTRAGVPLIERADLEGTKDRDILSDLAHEIETYLRGLSVAQLVCLAYGHRWPELIPGVRVPKGFRVVPSPQRNGVFLVTEACTRRVTVPGESSSCGTVRKSQTLPAYNGVRGVFDRGHMRNYDYDEDAWEKRPEGSRLTRIDFLDEIYRRMGRQLFAAEYEGTGE
jgi:hypothetical protein